VEEAQAKLRELISRLAPGEAIVITEDQRPVGIRRVNYVPGRSDARLEGTRAW
jgi:antitoxin (DNA-binding transcriptional repressor) of toxin-antitoxin stability system